MKERMKAVLRGVLPVLLDLEFPILVFPVLVTLIVAVTFLFPDGKCAAWQWWAAVFITFAFAFYRAPTYHRAIAIAGGWVVLLLLLWVLAQITLTYSWSDTIRCYLPDTRMMILGWNPVWQGTADGIEDAVGIAPENLRVWHVISMPHGAWFFSAAAWFFTKATFNLYFPLSFFLVLSVFYSVLAAFRKCGKLCVLAAFFIVLYFTPSSSGLADMAVALAGIGLLLAFAHQLNTGEYNWPKLISFTFWLLVPKPNGILHALVFWTVFLCFTFVHHNIKHLKRGLKIFGFSILLALPVLVSPWLTGAINYGHPLYPRYTNKPDKYPAVNITSDFLGRNEDAATMSHLGAWFNAHISADIAHAYYRWKMGKKEFKPWVGTYTARPHSEGSPTSTCDRFVICFTLMLLIFIGRRSERFVALALILASLVMPSEMIGYVRYTPWIFAGLAFCVPCIERIHNVRWSSVVKLICFALSTALYVPNLLFNFLIAVDESNAMQKFLDDPKPKIIINAYRNHTSEQMISMLGNVQLEMRMDERLARAELISDVPTSRYAEAYDKTPEKFPPFYDYSFKLTPDSGVNDFSYYRQAIGHENRRERLLAYPRFIARTMFVTFPVRVWEIVTGC